MCIQTGLVLVILASPIALFAGRPVERHNGRDAVPGEVIIRLKSSEVWQVGAVLAASGAEESSRLLQHDPVFVLRARGKKIQALLDALARRGEIAYAEPNYLVRTSAVPNDPNYPQLWALSNSGAPVLGSPAAAGSDIGAPAAWDISTGSSAAVVGIIDTGVDYNHPDLAPNMWSAPAAFSVVVNGRTITCPAGSHGYDAVAQSCQPLDVHNHGTHIAGIIGAAGNNSSGITGVNWTTRMMALRFIGADGWGSTADAITTIDFAIQVKARFGAGADVRVLSASWTGSGFSQALADAIQRAGGAGMLLVAAAGNDGSNNDAAPQYPANYALPNVVAVAATDAQDRLASFSNYGAGTVHLGAPGAAILSTLPNGNYGWMSGTSMATPFVSGAAALLLSKCSLTAAQLRSTLLGNVQPLASLAGRTTTGGRLDVNRSLRACAPPTPPPPSATGNSATWLGVDATTQGNWKALYGGDGHVLAGDSASLPAYAQFAVNGAASYTWAWSTTDARALVRTAGSDRLAATWYAGESFSYDIRLNDGNAHTVTLYLLDWDRLGRTQRIEVRDGETGTLLSAQTVSGYASGQYLSWSAKGRINIRVVRTGGVNAVVSGIFFGDRPITAVPVPPATTTADFTGFDSTTAGGWKTRYGTDGYGLAADASASPAYAAVAISGASSWTWSAGTAEARALERAGSTNRLAACWYSGAVITFDIEMKDRNPHPVSLYALDWDRLARAQRVEVIDPASGVVIDAREMRDFASGRYATWTITGSARIRVTNIGPANAVVSGLFFGGAQTSAPPPATGATASFVRFDNMTGGSWRGTYGSAGSALASAAPAYPAYATVTRAGAHEWTWASTTTDPRALQKPAPASDRVAAAWYTSSGMSFDIAIADGKTHTVALYALDFDRYARSQQVEIVETDTGRLLDTRAFSAFEAGVYGVWAVSGRVTIRVINAPGSRNAVVSALLFD